MERLKLLISERLPMLIVVGRGEWERCPEQHSLLREAIRSEGAPV